MCDMNRFLLRRAVERLRDGLFDSVAVERLTIEEEEIKRKFLEGLSALEKGKSKPLNICGSYGQGKSHTLAYLQQLALSLGYATSFVQLDVREIPFYRFSSVYRSLMEKLSIPGEESFAHLWKKWGAQHSLEILEDLPHRFRMILTAMLSHRLQKAGNQWLAKALIGHEVRLDHLRKILKTENIEGYQKKSLSCRGNNPYIQMILSLGKLLKEMGYKGLIVFFDEGESIAQGSLKNRAKSYEALDQFFESKGFFYPLFAFTDDFFEKVKQEEYENRKQLFPKNYGECWQDLNLVRFQKSLSNKWENLLDRLIQLYREAYHIDSSFQMAGIKEKLQELLEKLKTDETRFKLKALVHKLDIETQLL